MGTGASVEEREVLKTSIYSAAATVLQKLDGDDDVEDGGCLRCNETVFFKAVSTNKFN